MIVLSSSLSKFGSASATPSEESTRVGTALVPRYPLSHGYDLYGSSGNWGPDTGQPTIGPRATVLVIFKMAVVRDGQDDLIAWSKATNPPLEMGVYGLLGSERGDGGACLTTFSTPSVHVFSTSQPALASRAK